MKQEQRLLKLLKNIKFFSSLGENALRILQNKTQSVTFEKGEVLCKEGEKGDRLFIIDSGTVSVEKREKDGVSVEVAVLKQGDVAGELSLFGQAVRSATLRAHDRTKVWVLDHNTFRQLVNQHSEISTALLSYLSDYVRRETSIVAKLLSSDSDRRSKVAFFDSKPYTEKAFRESNSYDYALHFFEPRLSINTVPLAAGFKVICVFVNDNIDAAVVEELNTIGVEMIALRCAGYNNVDLEVCQHYGITVTRVPAYSPYAVAEHTVALMMTLNRRIHRANNRVREGNFSLNGLVGFDIHNKTAGVIGAGRVSRCLLNILAGFGCKLLVYSRTRYEELVNQLGVRFVELDELLSNSDIISVHVPLSQETHHLIDEVAINKMKPGVMLINTSRGGIVDTNALLDGLKSGRIGYAGLDVYEEESEYFFEDLSDRVLTDDTLARLTTFNNVIITSHQAFLTHEALCNIANTTLDSIREFELGKRMTELTNHLTSVSSV
ncbi:D-lactate dehydrogenase family protein [Chloroflexota bacterium]